MKSDFLLYYFNRVLILIKFRNCFIILSNLKLKNKIINNVSRYKENQCSRNIRITIFCWIQKIKVLLITILSKIK